MPELVVSSADTLKIIRPQAAIGRASTAVTAFIGRALKGPVNQAIAIASFDDYQRTFGGLWQPSTLSYAIEQYFESGGRECIVVRVCNGGRAPTIALPAGSETLTLVGLAPGTREFLRASVDYDGISPDETDRFNLVVQRIRAPGSEFIEDQEIFRRLSILPSAERALSAVLAESRLVRVQGRLPRQRPERSGGAPPAAAVGYVFSRGDGDDGDTLTNYDIIGDAEAGTGLFALRGAEAFNFLCVPPLARDLDVGLPALLVALRLCRARQALLLLDPPLAWSEPVQALEGLRSWALRSEDALMFFPRVVGLDRLRGRNETFGPAAAAAGQLARADASRAAWASADSDALLLRSNLRPACALTDLDRAQFSQRGVNVLQAARGAPTPPLALCTLTPAGSSKSDARALSARRLALFAMTSIERGTRWVVFEHCGPPLWARVRAQVLAFLKSLADEGAFRGVSGEQGYFVICDERLHEDSQAPAGQFQLLFGIATARPGDFLTCLVTHRPGASSVRVVSVNRYALPRQS